MSKDKVFHLIGWISDEHYADTALEIGHGGRMRFDPKTFILKELA